MSADKQNKRIPGDFESAVREMQELMCVCGDFKIRRIKLQDRHTAFFYIEQMIEEQKLNEFLLSDTLQNGPLEETMNAVSSAETDEIRKLIDGILAGQVVFLSDASRKAKLFSVGQNPPRSIMEPESESIVRGAHDGFVESLETNIHQPRFHIQDRHLSVHYMDIGERAKSKVAVIFVENIANPEIVEEVKRRLSYLRIDSVLAPGIIEESIEDNSFSIFPQIIHTERPDKAKACVMEGCVLIMMDGSPSALIAPITFFSFFNRRMTTARDGFPPVF